MSDTLRLPLLLLVLINVGFVQLTGAVSAMWTLPLYGLTLAAPAFVRFQNSELYKLAWNLGVLAVFGSLAMNAQRVGVMHLLEDGLLLAALCQVHLLNNLSTRQRPDLLFFNSFLIAFVTSFFSQDFGFSVLFLLYVASLVPALQLFCATRHATDQRLPRRVVGAIVRNSVPRTAVAVACTVGVFLLWPRDFAREGWVTTDTQLTHAMRMAMGLADHVNPERSGSPGQGEGVLLRIRVTDGNRTDLPRHWRGSSFIDYGRRGWRDRLGSNGPKFDWQWRRTGQRMVRVGEPTLRAEVTLEQGASAWLMAPYSVCSLEVSPPADSRFVASRPDGNLRYESWFDTSRGANLEYEVGMWSRAPAPPVLGFAGRLQLLATDDQVMPPALDGLLARLATALPDGASPALVAQRFAQHFRDNWDYALPGQPGAAVDLDHFFAGAPGHCEYFATALTLLLRKQGVPARLVSGVLVGEWDEDRREYVVREKHAHAWVEAWDPQLGWVTVDPTPASEAETVAAGSGWWAELKAPLVELWRDLAGFNRDAYGSVTAWLSALPGRVGSAVGHNPWWSALGSVVLGCVVYLWRRRRRPPAAIANYRAAVRRMGLAPAAGETPRELLARARTLPAPQAADLERLTAAIHAHEQCRYAGTEAGG